VDAAVAAGAAAWSAAAANVRNVSVTGRAGVTPGSIMELPAGTVTEKPNRWLPVNEASTSAAAALKVEWPETYSANGGVTTAAGW
jgi:hypothetical protein